jgi:hypothetical protein
MAYHRQAFAFQFGVQEYSRNVYQIRPAVAPDDARFAEKGIDRYIGTGKGTGMGGCCPPACIRSSGLDRCKPATLTHKGRGMLEQEVRLIDIFYIQ